MSRLFKQKKPLKDYKVPPEVQEAWDVVAEFLNKLPELTFHISPWNEKSKSTIRPNQYTLHAGGDDLTDITIVSKSKWKSEDKQ